MNQPWIRFFPGDWRRDPGLACVSLSARGLWIELLAVMHDCDPVGTLAINGRAPTEAQIAALVRSTPDDVRAGLAELESAGVFSRDSEGRIFSRRMARDAEESSRQAARLSAAGARGARSRWQSDGQANAIAMARPSKKDGQANGQAMAYARARADSDSDSDTDSGSSSDSGTSSQSPPTVRGAKSQTWEAVLEEWEFGALRGDVAWLAAWDEWIEHCRTPGTKGKVPRGPRAKAIFRDALRWGPSVHAEAIRASIRNDWQGINPEWLRRPQGQAKTAGELAVEEFERRHGGEP